jgi:hypothetical protein
MKHPAPPPVPKISGVLARFVAGERTNPVRYSGPKIRRVTVKLPAALADELQVTIEEARQHLAITTREAIFEEAVRIAIANFRERTEIARRYATKDR